MRLTKVYQFQSERRPANMSESQILDDMPYCDDCEVVFDNIHDVQRHIKDKWCPVQQKRQRESNDEEDVHPKKTTWLTLSDVYDSENTSDQDNNAFQGMYTNAQNQNETIWEKNPNIYVEDSLPKKKKRLQADEDIREFVRRDFF